MATNKTFHAFAWGSHLDINSQWYVYVSTVSTNLAIWVAPTPTDWEPRFDADGCPWDDYPFPFSDCLGHARHFDFVRTDDDFMGREPDGTVYFIYTSSAKVKIGSWFFIDGTFYVTPLRASLKDS